MLPWANNEGIMAWHAALPPPIPVPHLPRIYGPCPYTSGLRFVTTHSHDARLVGDPRTWPRFADVGPYLTFGRYFQRVINPTTCGTLPSTLPSIWLVRYTPVPEHLVD